MDPIIEEFSITLKYQVSVNTETGEMTTKCVSRKIDKSNFEVTEQKAKKTSKVKKNESSEPILTLEDNKYSLTQAAVDLMELGSDDKLDIKYEKINNKLTPVIASDSVWGTKGGNKLTKSLTVACRGSKNEELSKFGSEFVLIPHTDKPGRFILKSTDENIKEENIEDVESLEEEIAFPIDEDLQDLIDGNANIKETDSSIFNFN